MKHFSTLMVMQAATLCCEPLRAVRVSAPSSLTTRDGDALQLHLQLQAPHWVEALKQSWNEAPPIVSAGDHSTCWT
jgi:hypothetical protein